jgi:hypothetical protein
MEFATNALTWADTVLTAVRLEWRQGSHPSDAQSYLPLGSLCGAVQTEKSPVAPARCSSFCNGTVFLKTKALAKPAETLGPSKNNLSS